MARPRVVAPARLTIREAAVYCDVHPDSIRRWIRSGRLKANRVGPRLIKIDRVELDKVIESIGGSTS
jgi:excisionase family DNA binding protein